MVKFYRLGEVCNHIGCLLLVSVYSVEIHEGKGRTEDKCTWADLSSQPVISITKKLYVLI
jgi:hypothetical protein